jgi:hypothetical protein
MNPLKRPAEPFAQEDEADQMKRQKGGGGGVRISLPEGYVHLFSPLPLNFVPCVCREGATAHHALRLQI